MLSDKEVNRTPTMAVPYPGCLVLCLCTSFSTAEIKCTAKADPERRGLICLTVSEATVTVGAEGRQLVTVYLESGSREPQQCRINAQVCLCLNADVNSLIVVVLFV